VTAALLCDLDGTLVESRASVEAAWRRWADRAGLEPGTVLARTFAGPSREVIASLAPWLDAASEAAVVDGWQVDDAVGAWALPGALDLMLSAPRGRLAIVTSCSRALALARLEAAGLPVPPVLVTAEMVSAGKPDPEGYLRAAGALGVPAGDCLVVEDAPAGVRAAVAAGMRVIAVATTHPAAELVEAERIVTTLFGLGTEITIAP
jgi:sugar-phosphatase